MANSLKIRRGLEANLPTLNEGEPGFATDSGKVWFGDGATNHRVAMHNDYDAQSILAAVTSNSPAAVALSEGNLVGRVSGGDVGALTGADVMGILSGTAGAGFNMNSQKVTNLADGTADTDAATWGQVQSLKAAFDPKASVRAATNGTNIDLTSSTDPNPIDGVTLSDGDRVLLKDQSTASENGIYDAVTATDPTSWTRSSDADEDDEVTACMFVPVAEGTNNNDTFWLLTTNDPITVGTTDLTFQEFGGGDTNTDSKVAVDDSATPGTLGADGASGVLRTGSLLTYSDGGDYVSINVDTATLLENSPSSGENNKAPDSAWAYSHTNAASGVHGAGSETLLNTGSTIDCGTF